MFEGKTLKAGAVGPSQVKGFGHERWGRLENGIDVKSTLMLEHVRIENDSRIDLETFSDHPAKGNAGEAVTLAVCDRSTTNIWGCVREQ